jgi:hypothetical protein
MREAAGQLQHFLGLNKGPGVFLRMGHESIASAWQSVVVLEKSKL